ncbi:MAG TPA: hypothetical protein VG323_21425 [Thermoanaerobaculia bacterium]|nr:hypothetical protein [Thermoanaerobaculia bacterium]
MKILINVAISALLASQAFAWSPEVCNAGDLSGRARFEAVMRTMKPGDPAYVVKPFPRNNAEVIADFTQQAQDKLNKPVAPFLRAGQNALQQAMEQGALHIAVVREANWRNHRCVQYRSGETVFLLRLYDTAKGVEVARATIEESGLMNGIMYPLDRTAPVWSKPLMTLAEGEGLLNATFGKVVDVQYAMSDGTIGCDEWLPCVSGRIAGRDGGYAVVSFKGIYTFDTESRRVDQRPSTVKDKASLQASMQSFEKLLRSLGPREGLTTVGGTYDVIATKVADR